jgi:hypothetical protein
MDTWEYKIIYDKDVKTYYLVEYFDGSYAEIEMAETLQEIEKELIDDFFAKIKAIRNYEDEL